MKPNENFANKRNAVEQKGENLKTYLQNKDGFAFGFGSASQRLALPALGRGRRSRPARKMLRRGKGLGCAQNPQRQVHALLARFWLTDAQTLKKYL